MPGQYGEDFELSEPFERALFIISKLLICYLIKDCLIRLIVWLRESLKLFGTYAQIKRLEPLQVRLKALLRSLAKQIFILIISKFIDHQKLPIVLA